MASKNRGTGRPVARAPEQDMIPDLPEQPGYDGELHALWIEKCELQESAGRAREALKSHDEKVRKALDARGIDHYKHGDADLWCEPVPPKVKAKKPGGRKKGKIKKVVAGKAEPQE